MLSAAGNDSGTRVRTDPAARGTAALAMSFSTSTSDLSAVS